MPSCDSRHQTWRFQALQDDPELLFLRPATAAAKFDDGEALGKALTLWLSIRSLSFARILPHKAALTAWVRQSGFVTQ